MKLTILQWMKCAFYVAFSSPQKAYQLFTTRGKLNDYRVLHGLLEDMVIAY